MSRELRAAHASGQTPDAARRPARSARGAGPRRRNGDQRGPAEAVRQHGTDDRRAVRGDRHGHRGTAAALRRHGKPRALARPGCSRPSPSPRRSLLLAFARMRRTPRHLPAVDGAGGRRAGGLPARARFARALLPAAGARNGDSAAREDRRAGTRSSRPRSRTSGAPTSCSSPSSATRNTSNRRATPRCARSPLAPDLASAHVTLGFLYAFTDQNDLASHELDEALRLDKFNAAAYGALAELQTGRDAPTWWRPTLQKAVSLAPDDWLLNMQLGAHYLDRGKWAQAGEQFRHAVELVPDNPRALQQPRAGLPRTGQARRRRGRFSEGDRSRADVHSLQEPGHGAGRSGKVSRRPRRRSDDRSRCVRISIARGDSSPPSIAQSARRRGEGQGHVSQSDRAGRRPAEGNAEGRVSAGRRRRLLRGAREGEGEPAAARAGGGAGAGQSGSALPGGRRLRDCCTTATRRCGWLAKARAGGYPSEAIARESAARPRFARTRDTARPPPQIADASTKGEK